MTQHLIKLNSLFFLSFENEEDRTSFSKYYTPKGEIKDFNVYSMKKGRSKKKYEGRFFALVKIMITQLVIY